jgi:hypothetical protein
LRKVGQIDELVGLFSQLIRAMGLCVCKVEMTPMRLPFCRAAMRQGSFFLRPHSDFTGAQADCCLSGMARFWLLSSLLEKRLSNDG